MEHNKFDTVNLFEPLKVFEMKMFDRCIVLDSGLYNVLKKENISTISFGENASQVAFFKGEQYTIKEKGKRGIIYNTKLVRYLKQKYGIQEQTGTFSVYRQSQFFVMDFKF